MPESNQRILVVDDDAPIRDMFAIGLSQYGYQCATAVSADAAAQALEREKFDLMLLDINMPGKTGMQFLAELPERYPDMAIVMVTSHDELSTAVLAMRDGAYDYIPKPVNLALLVFRVEKALARRALLLENNANREQLELMVKELNQRLEQNGSLLEALNTLVQSLMTPEQIASDAYGRLKIALTAFGSGIESLGKFAEAALNETPDPRELG